MKQGKPNGCNKQPRIAVILAGGKSRRFGSNKALATLDGETLVEKITRTLKSSGFEVAIHTADDDPLPGEGPLQALYGALLQRNCSRLLLAACDMPLIESPVIETLWETGREVDITLLEFREKKYPLPGVYSRTILPYVKDLLNQGKRDLKCLSEAGLTTKVLPEKDWRRWDPKARSVHNINTLKDLTEALINSF